MRLPYALLVVLSILLGSVPACRRPASAPHAILRPAPAWTLPDVDGRKVQLADFKGKVVILDFWATWCPPCQAEIPGYIALQKKYAAGGLAVVGVSLDSAGPAAVKQFMAEHHMNYPVVMGTDAVVGAYGNFEGIPTTFIIDREGNIVHQKTGGMETADYEQVLRPFLK